MKILFVGVWKDSTGWSKASEDYILALDAAGVDVVPRALKLNDNNPNLPPRLLELEAKSSRGCDVVIQHCLPHHLDYNGRFALNVGMYATETSDFRQTAWAERINCMDRAIVFNRQSAEASRRSGVTVPISVVPHATDISRFQRSYPHLEVIRPQQEQGDFLFYWVGEFVRRKNLAALLKAFYLEFRSHEPVGLVIKTSKPGMSSEDCGRMVEDFCAEIRRGLKLRDWKEETIITDRLTDEGMMRLHSTCDCFVMPSYGEAFCIPVFDSMAMGKTPIVTACTGFLDYVTDEVGWLVKCREEPVFGVNDTFEDLFVGTETWSAVDVIDLRRCMREAYENNALREEKSINGISRAYDYSYETVGAKLLQALTT